MYIKFIIFLLLFSISIGLNAQNLANSENTYQNLKQELEKEQKNLDSLMVILNERATQIDLEKDKNDADESNVVKLLAESVTISNKIDFLQKRIALLREDISYQQGILLNKYISTIDSLELLQDDLTSQEMKNNIEQQILFYKERKLSVSPKIKSLSYDPDKILQIDLSKIKDSDDRELYLQYLNRAIMEVDNQLLNIQNIVSEVEGMLQLQRKANRFMDAIDMDVNIAPYTIVANDNNIDDSQTFGESISRMDNLLEIDSYFILMRQLDWIQTQEEMSRWQSPSDSLYINLSLDDYQKLLQDLTKKLIDYKSILAQKLNSRK